MLFRSRLVARAARGSPPLQPWPPASLGFPPESCQEPRCFVPLAQGLGLCCAPAKLWGSCLQQIDNGSDLLVVKSSVMLSGATTQASGARSPAQLKLALLAAALGPASIRTSRLCSLLLHSACKGSMRRLAASSGSGGWLWVPHAFQSLPALSKELGTRKQSFHFCFHC